MLDNADIATLLQPVHLPLLEQNHTMSESVQNQEEVRRPFGGQYVAESIIESLQSLQDAFEDAWADVSFRLEFQTELKSFRPPTQLQRARKLTKVAGGAQIFLKREDSNFTGSHNITNALGQALLARRLNKRKVLAETGSGNHGVATAAVCQKLGLECEIFIGANDAQTRPHQVKQMKMYGAKVIGVTSGEANIREAVAAVLRTAVEQHETAYLLLGGAYGPRPIPMIASAFQQILGIETKKQMLSTTGQLPKALVACSGIHGPSVGLFDCFTEDKDVQLVAVESAGCGLDTELHAAVLARGSLGIYNGAHTLVLQDEHGQIDRAHSIAPDMRYPSVSPWLAKWHSEGRIAPVAVADDEALLGCSILSRSERIDCDIEDGHAVAAGVIVASKMRSDECVVICIGGSAI